MNRNSIEQLKTEYDRCMFKIKDAPGRKELVYWSHRATELKQVMDNLYAHGSDYSGLH